MHNRQVKEIWRMCRRPAIYINHKLILLFLYHFPFLSCWTMSKTLDLVNKELKKIKRHGQILLDLFDQP